MKFSYKIAFYLISIWVIICSLILGILFYKSAIKSKNFSLPPVWEKLLPKIKAQNHPDEIELILTQPHKELIFKFYPRLTMGLILEDDKGLYSIKNISYKWHTDAGKIISIQNNQFIIKTREKGGTYSLSLEENLLVNYQQKNIWKSQCAKNFIRSVTFPIVIGISKEELKDGYLRGYRIGNYPNPDNPKAPPHVKTHKWLYAVPNYFYEVRRETEKLKISPHFSLGDFDLNFDYKPEIFPHYIVLDFKLVKKLEVLLQIMKLKGLKSNKIKIISGFRSPYYNATEISKGADLKTVYSRHQYGNAVDFIIDQNPTDDIMDDLNDDGIIDIKDADIIFNLLDEVDKLSGIPGGGGSYAYHDIPNRIQSPYVHLDARGYKARWRKP